MGRLEREKGVSGSVMGEVWDVLGCSGGGLNSKSNIYSRGCVEICFVSFFESLIF